MLALVVLVVNDHVWKRSHALPALLTGKLSDLAGYYLFPMLLAALIGARSRRALAACHAVTAALLVATELSPPLCAAIARVLPIRLWADPTDLVALASIAASWVVLVPAARGAHPVRPLLARALALFGGLASVATSQQPPPVAQRPPRLARAALRNSLGQEVEVRVSGLRSDVTVDCGALLAAPAGTVPPEWFRVVRDVRVVPSGAVSLDGAADFTRGARAGDDCAVVLLSAPYAADAVLAFRRDAQTERDLSQPDAATTVELLQTVGAPYFRRTRFATPEAVLEPAVSDRPPASGEGSCALAPAGGDPDWSTPLPGPAELELRAMAHGSDGCDDLALGPTADPGAPAQHVYLCAAGLPLPFGVGERIALSPTVDGSDGVVVTSAAAQVVLVRRRGQGTFTVHPACVPVRRACAVAVAAELVVPTPAGATRALGSGATDEVVGAGRRVTVRVTRAERLVAVDARCDASLAVGDDASFAWISRKEGK